MNLLVCPEFEIVMRVGDWMKRSVLLLALIMVMIFTGCSYAPGNEKEPFIEKWLDLPSVELNEYQSSKVYVSETQPEETVSVTETVGPIEAPDVNLAELPPRAESDFVRVKDYIPDIIVDVKYATANNFTGDAVYDFSDAYLRYGTVVKLMKVQEELRQKGYLLKIWDSFRTMDAAQTLYKESGGKGFSNPKTGNNSQCRGNTVDVTLVNAQGIELEMPTGHDVFNSYSDRNYGDCTVAAADNAKLLQEVMQKHGFEGLSSEWWQFTDTVDYDVETCFDPGEKALYYAVCEEFINIRSAPSYDAGAIAKIKPDEQFTVWGWAENNFAYIDYNGQRGYVNAKYIAKVQ